jgi:hypothetical protein
MLWRRSISLRMSLYSTPKQSVTIALIIHPSYQSLGLSGRPNIRRKETKGCQVKTNAPQNGAFLPLLSKLAGSESLNWHPLIADFILVGRKLEKLGFIYSGGKVIVLENME